MLNKDRHPWYKSKHFQKKAFELIVFRQLLYAILGFNYVLKCYTLQHRSLLYYSDYKSQPAVLPDQINEKSQTKAKTKMCFLT